MLTLQDNPGKVKWTEEMQGLRKVKQISIKYHYMHDEVQHGIIEA